MRLEETLCKTPRKIPEHEVRIVLVVLMTCTDICRRQLDALRYTLILLAWQDSRQMARRLENLDNVRVAAVLRRGIKCVPQLLALECVFDTLDYGLVAVAVVDNRIALAAVDEAFNKLLATPSDCDDRVDVCQHSELDGICAEDRKST